MSRRCQLEMDNKMLTEKLAALKNQNKSEERDELDVNAMYCTQPLVEHHQLRLSSVGLGKLHYTCMPVNK